MLSLGLAGLTMLSIACHPGMASVLFPLAFNPCDYGGTSSFHMSGVGRPNWGGRTEWLDRSSNDGIRKDLAGGHIEVFFLDSSEDTSHALAGEALEVYQGERRQKIPSHFEHRGPQSGSCGHAFVTTYDLSSLGPGTYTLVHRQSSGASDDASCGKELCAWGSYQGEPALVTTLVIPGPDELSPLSMEELDARLDERAERLQNCYQRAANYGDRYPGKPPEHVIVSLSVVPDRTYGLVERPDAIEGVSKALEMCLQSILPIELDGRPREAATIQVLVDVEGKKKATAEVSLARVITP